VWTTLVWFSNLSWLAALVGLVLFRIFDVTKPPPARRLDDEGDNGITVIADDLVAGVWAIPGVVLVVWLFAARL
jgi:phosphatidylglycerophosphatase A